MTQMKSDMSAHVEERQAQRHARVAGAAYILVIALGATCAGGLERVLPTTGDAAEAVAAVGAHETLIRAAFLGEIIMYALVIVLALSLYEVLRECDAATARLALAFRGAEAVLGATFAVLSTALPLYLLQEAADPHLSEFALALTGLHAAGMDVVLVVMGMGGALFFTLFFRSGLIARFWALWGLAVYVGMTLVFAAKILIPVPQVIELTAYAFGGLFKLAFGVALLVSGVRRPPGAPRNIATTPAH